MPQGITSLRLAATSLLKHLLINICYNIGESEVHIMPESKLRSQSNMFSKRRDKFNFLSAKKGIS